MRDWYISVQELELQAVIFHDGWLLQLEHDTLLSSAHSSAFMLSTNIIEGVSLTPVYSLTCSHHLSLQPSPYSLGKQSTRIHCRGCPSNMLHLRAGEQPHANTTLQSTRTPNSPGLCSHVVPHLPPPSPASDQPRSTNDARFFHYLDFLESNKRVEHVLLTDISGAQREKGADEMFLCASPLSVSLSMYPLFPLSLSHVSVSLIHSHSVSSCLSLSLSASPSLPRSPSSSLVLLGPRTAFKLQCLYFFVL